MSGRKELYELREVVSQYCDYRTLNCYALRDYSMADLLHAIDCHFGLQSVSSGKFESFRLNMISIMSMGINICVQYNSCDRLFNDNFTHINSLYASKAYNCTGGTVKYLHKASAEQIAQLDYIEYIKHELYNGAAHIGGVILPDYSDVKKYKEMGLNVAVERETYNSDTEYDPDVDYSMIQCVNEDYLPDILELNPREIGFIGKATMKGAELLHEHGDKLKTVELQEADQGVIKCIFDINDISCIEYVCDENDKFDAIEYENKKLMELGLPLDSYYYYDKADIPESHPWKLCIMIRHYLMCNPQMTIKSARNV